MKQCTKCNITKALGEFSKQKGGSNGLRARCKACVKVNDYKRYMRRKENSARRATKKYYVTYRDKQLLGTPKWLSVEQVNEMKKLYLLAKLKSLNEGKQWQVDHIIPLQGSTVSGLHVPWNLQIILKRDNVRKGNRYASQSTQQVPRTSGA